MPTSTTSATAIVIYVQSLLHSHPPLVVSATADIEHGNARIMILHDVIVGRPRIEMEVLEACVQWLLYLTGDIYVQRREEI